METMNEGMFAYSGEKVKSMAQILFWVDVIACVVLAFVFGWDDYERFHAGWFFGYLIIGPIVSYCMALLTYAFGELVKNSQKLCKAGKMTSLTSDSVERKQNKASFAILSEEGK